MVICRPTPSRLPHYCYGIWVPINGILQQYARFMLELAADSSLGTRHKRKRKGGTKVVDQYTFPASALRLVAMHIEVAYIHEVDGGAVREAPLGPFHGVQPGQVLCS